MAVNNGGALYFKDTILNMDDTQFENCTADNDWGCLFMDQNSQMRLTNTEFESGKAANNGGCVYIHQLGNDITLTNISTKWCFAQISLRRFWTIISCPFWIMTRITRRQMTQEVYCALLATRQTHKTLN